MVQPLLFCPHARLRIAAILLLALAAERSVFAQQARVGVPMRATGDAFFEQNGMAWGVNGPGWFFRFGGGAGAPFGGAAPGAGIAGGAAIAGGGVNAGLGFMAGQGSRRSNVMQSGNLTLFNGHPGFLSDTSQSPFVTGLVPFVGQGMPPWRQQLEGHIPRQTPDAQPRRDAAVPEPPPAAARGPQTPSADDPGRFSLAELNQRRAVEEANLEKEAAALLTKARGARAEGKTSVARIYYQMAARRCQGSARETILAELKQLEAAAAPQP